MLGDLFHLPPEFRGDVQIFTRPCTVTDIQWETWRKPRGVSMTHIICIGGGGGGGGGFTRSVGNAGGGGGGGGSSGIVTVTIPTFLLPEILSVQVGAGGAGVLSGGGTAPSGVLSFVAVAPNATATNVIARSGAVAATGGATGLTGGVGVQGVASTLALIATMPRAGLGQYTMIAGHDGTGGGAHTGANGTTMTIPATSVCCMGGTGGGGAQSGDFTGGPITAIAGSYLSEQRPIPSAAGTTGAGSGGPQVWEPFFSFGGMGGSSSNAAAGCAGGNGAYGAGGGGGGAGTTGGRGGDGGSGIVMIISW